MTVNIINLKNSSYKLRLCCIRTNFKVVCCPVLSELHLFFSHLSHADNVDIFFSKNTPILYEYYQIM